MNPDLDTADVVVEDALASLKQQAELMGISYHPNISEAKLAERIEEHRAKFTKEDKPEVAPTSTKQLDAAKAKRQTLQDIRNKAMALQRVNITCMNPAKGSWQGELFTTGNSIVSTFTRMVPFNTTDGTHVENMILDQIKARMCQVFVETRVNGVKVRQGKQIKEFGIEYLDPLTPKELEELKQRQLMAAGA